MGSENEHRPQTNDEIISNLQETVSRLKKQNAGMKHRINKLEQRIGFLTKGRVVHVESKGERKANAKP